MSAYAIVRIDIHDEENYARYVPLAGEAIRKYNGRFLVRGGDFTVREGEARGRNVVIEFADRAAAEAFYESPEYSKALEYALPASTRDYIIIDGAE